MSIYPYAFESSTGSYKTSTINNILLLLVPCAKMSTTAMQFIGNPSPPATAGICIKYPGHDAKSAGGWLQYSKTHMRQDSSSFRRHQPCNNQNSVVRTLHHSGWYSKRASQSYSHSFSCMWIAHRGSARKQIIIIMYIYHALINALSAHMIHINLNMIFYTHVEQRPTKTIYIKY